MAEKLTREQAAILSAATGTLCGPFYDCQELAERLLGRPVYTHELGDKEIAEEIKQAARPLLLKIVPEE